MKYSRGSNQYQRKPRARGIILSAPFWLTVAIISLIAALIYRFKTEFFLLLLTIFNLWAVNYIAPHILETKPAQAIDSPYVSDHPVTEHEQIIAYIKEIFGDQADNAFKILSCENPRLLPDATGHNTNGTTDTGVFQVNSIWGNPAILKDYKTNINAAYVIFKRGGWNEWACEYVYHVLDK